MSILRSSLEPLNQHLRFVFLDVFWRSLWLGLSAMLLPVFWFVIVAQLGAVEWEGPELGASNPIMLLAALQQFWDAYGATLVAELGVLLLGILILWIVLEALFRGGFKGFWVYLGTSIGRLALLGGAAVLFLMVAPRMGPGDERAGTLLIGVVVIMGLWFIVALLETAIRKDALDVVALNLGKVAGVVGVLLLSEVVLAFLLWGSALAALTAASTSAASALAMVILVVVSIFWMVLHSYLVAVRFSAIEQMRRNVVR